MHQPKERPSSAQPRLPALRSRPGHRAQIAYGTCPWLHRQLRQTGCGPESHRCAGVPCVCARATEGQGGRPRVNQLRPGAHVWVGGQSDARSPPGLTM